MSELIATTAQEIVRTEKDCDYMDELFGGVKMPPTQVYLKSEADKVIAELIEKNERLSDDCLIKASNTFREIEKEIRHHKYKRCLGIAAVCFEKSYSTTLVKYDKESGYRLNFYDWWGKRWLELAEKFKEAE